MTTAQTDATTQPEHPEVDPTVLLECAKAGYAARKIHFGYPWEYRDDDTHRRYQEITDGAIAEYRRLATAPGPSWAEVSTAIEGWLSDWAMFDECRDVMSSDFLAALRPLWPGANDPDQEEGE